MINKVAIDDRLPVAVCVNGLSEDLARVQRGRRREADAHGVEMIEHTAILRLVILLTDEADLLFRKLAIEDIAAMAFVHDDAIVGVHWKGRSAFCGEEKALHHALDGGDVDPSFGLGAQVADLFDLVDFGKALEPFEFHVAEGIASLRAEFGAIHEEEHAAKPLGADDPVEQ